MTRSLDILERCVSFLASKADGEDPEEIERACRQARKAIEDLREGKILLVELDPLTREVLEKMARSVERIAVGLDKARENAIRAMPTVPNMGGRRI